MSEKRMFVDVNVIQSVPPSCVNRDDTGSPKTCIYGGVRRARVSSQSWKRAMREMFIERMEPSALGIRTKKVVQLIADRIAEIDPSKKDDAPDMAAKILETGGIPVAASKKKKANPENEELETGALFFISSKQVDNVANLALAGETNKKVILAALNKDHGIDVALFGRMVASEPSLNTDAASQVAHAISTHRVDNEYDYFTAVDDMKPKDDSGAGMVGTIEFASSTLYRYATVAVHDLEKTLENKDVAAKVVSEFVRAFILSMPAAKQSTFGNRTLPYAVYVSVREDQPLNLSPAFETPVAYRAEGGFNGSSVKKMEEYARSAYGSFVDAPVKSWIIGVPIPELGDAVPLSDALESIEEFVKEN